MPNWSDPAVIEDNAKAFSNVLLFVLGWYVWEFVATLWVEASFIIQPRRKWRLEHVSYFACRYSFLLFSMNLVAFYNVTQEIHCPAFALSAQILGLISVGIGTLNLLYRAWAISRSYSRLLTIILAIAQLAHWAILVWSVSTLHSQWLPALKKCNAAITSRPALVTVYAYTMLFHFMILLICLTGLYKHSQKAGPAQGQFWQLLRRQGIHYFFFSFAANLFPFIFVLLDLNPVMNIIPTVPAACVTTIASCRAVIWMTTWVETDGSGFADHPSTSSAAPPGIGRRRPSGRKPTGCDLEGAAVATGDVGLPSEIFARTRRNDEAEQVVRSSLDDPEDYKTPASPSHYSPTSATHPVVLTLSDKGENQAGASGSTPSSVHRPDTSPLLLAPKGYYPYDDRGRPRRAISPDSTPSTWDEDRPVREHYHRS